MILATPPAPPLTEQAEDLDRLWNVFLVGAAIVALIVAGLIVFVVVRNRGRTGLPTQTRVHIPLELAYTAVPLLVVIALFAMTVGSLREVDRVDDRADVDLVVDVVGFQWQWQFAYAERGVVVTGTDQERPELALPAGATVRFDLQSVDVIHSFWIPGFRFKRDMFPGDTTTFQVDVGTVTGSWPDTGVCAEFCGLDHAYMRFDVTVLPPEEFDAWLTERTR